MPNRVLRDWTESDKVNILSAHAERFFTRLIMKADDYGCFYADTRILKANLFPLLLDSIREADLLRWMAECQKAGLIVLYESNGKRYLQITNFGQRLRQMKHKFPLPDNVSDMQTDDSNLLPDDSNPPLETEEETEEEKKGNEKPAGSAGANAPPDNSLELYKKIEKTKTGIYEFLKAKPLIIEPYIDFWNLFAVEKGLSKVEKVSDSRKRKFKIRIREDAFNFPEILRKAGQSEFLRTGKWFGFDWILENDSNYLKVLEGNYDGKKLGDNTVSSNSKKLSEIVKQIENENV